MARIPTVSTPPGHPAFAKPLDDLIAQAALKKTTTKLFSTLSYSSCIRDPNCWTNPLDLSCVVAWNSHMGNKEAVTSISSRHVAMANHYHVIDGTPVYFVSKDNEIFTRTVTSMRQVGRSDILLGYLNELLPDNIKPATLMRKVQNDKIFIGTPILYVNEAKEVHTADLSSMGIGVMIKKSLHNPARAKFFAPVLGDDSGNPFFLVKGTDLVMVSHFTTSNGGIGYPFFIDQILYTASLLGPEEIRVIEVPA